ncbi:hypothetical protein D3C81_144510 [compost metagenome]
MNIGGALGTIGNQTIGTFPWGEMVAKICNFHLPEDKLVALTDSGSAVMEKIVAMEDKIQIAILTMDIGNLEGVESSSSRGVNVMKTGAVITALAMVVIGVMASWDPNAASWDKETLSSVFEAGKELISLLLGM